MLPLFGRVRQRFAAWAENWPQGVHALERDADDPHPPALALCYLALLTSTMSADALSGLVKRLRISGVEAGFLGHVARLREATGDLEAAAMLPSTLYRQLHPYAREARFVLSVLTESPVVCERLDLYERELAAVKPHINGHFLRGLGLPPGPIYREIIDRVRDALLDQQISTVAEEQALARRLAAAAHRLAGHR
jgi:tRNA nucleotidyltransferase (CCA-adding enzyme)